MHPVLFTLGAGDHAWALHIYGLSIAVGFLVAIAVGVRAARQAGEDGDAVRDLCFWLLVSSLVGARLLFIITNIPDYIDACRTAGDCTRGLRVWEGGLVFYGGFFAALVTAIGYLRWRKMRFWRVADALAPSVALGHFFGRLGCWCAGCCWGTEAHGVARAWAARFPPASLAWQDYVARGALGPGSPTTPPLHPVQLYEALCNLALFVMLSWLARRKRWDGQVLCGYLAGYALIRFALEFLRGDAARKMVYGPISTSQLIALLALPLALAIGWTRRRSAFSRA